MGVALNDPYKVVKKLLRTEKGSILSQKQNKYLFDVDLSSNKMEIKKAVQAIYNVKVLRVNTQIVPGKPKTVRFIAGYRADWKKAFVTLASGQSIKLTT